MLKGRGLKTLNSYQAAFPNYDKTPKAVIAAIAVSLALKLHEDAFDYAVYEISKEWTALYNAGIVPQKPKRERKA